MIRPEHYVPEKPVLKSKKFIAYLVTESLTKAVMFTTLIVFAEQLKTATIWGWWFLIANVIVSGFVASGFIIGQASLDRYVRVAQIVAAGPNGNGNGGTPLTPQRTSPPADPEVEVEEPEDEEELPPGGPQQPAP